MRGKRSLTAVLLVTFGCLASSDIFFAQAVQNTTVSPTFNGIDGSVHPELISDDQALQMWLIAAGGATDTSPERLSRRKVKVNAIELNAADSATVLAAASVFGDGQKALALEASLSSAGATSQDRMHQHIQRQQREAQLFATAKTQMYSQLSADGTRKMADHLLHVKKHMKIANAPNMNNPSPT